MCNNARPIRDLARPETAAARWPHIDLTNDPRPRAIRKDVLDHAEKLLAEASREYARFRPQEESPFKLVFAPGGAALHAHGLNVTGWMSRAHKVEEALVNLVIGMRAVADATPGSAPRALT